MLENYLQKRLAYKWRSQFLRSAKRSGPTTGTGNDKRRILGKSTAKRTSTVNKAFTIYGRYIFFELYHIYC